MTRRAHNKSPSRIAGLRRVALVCAAAVLPGLAWAEGAYELRARSAANDLFAMESSRPGAVINSDLNLPRITYLKVDISDPNEVIDLYTSITDNTAPGNQPLDIAVWCPGNEPDLDAGGQADLSGYQTDYQSADWTVDVQNNQAGDINNFGEVVAVQTVAGRPRAPQTFAPAGMCGIPGTVTGTYTVRLYGGCCQFSRPVVQFFDVMVRDTGSNALRRGRLWSNHWALLAQDGFNGNLQAEFFAVAGQDNGSSYSAHLWEIDSNGMQPFGFHMWASAFGALPDTYYRKSVADNANPTPIMQPDYPMYLNTPAKPIFAPPPPVVSGFRFNQFCSGVDPTGGEFTFTTNGDWNYEIALDENNDGQYELSEVVLVGLAGAGANVVPWDGRNASGVPVATGTPLVIRLENSAGEVHLPMYDVENRNASTGPIITHATVTSGTPTLYFWDDTLVGQGTSPVGGSATPHTWNEATGNRAIIDTWKFFESTTEELSVSYGATCIYPGHVTGTVYSDADHNSQRDGGETGLAGVTVVLHDPVGASCTSVQTDGNGFYEFLAVPPGGYEVFEAVGETVPTPLACPPVGADLPGYVSTTPNRRIVTVADIEVPNQDFGDFGGSSVTGQVFDDNGSGGGTAHNAAVDGAEPGLAGVVVQLTDGGGTVYDSAVTDGTGRYTLWVPDSASTVAVETATPGGFVSVSEAAGNTGGAVDTAYDILSFTAAPGSNYAGVNFGDARVPAFAPDHNRSVLPGTIETYPHTFTAYTTGVVTFALVNETATPAGPAWGAVLHRDSDCSGTLEAGEPVIVGPIAVDATAANTVCVIVKVFAPAAAPFNAEHRVQVRANFNFTGSATPANVQLQTDLTRIGTATSSELQIGKSVDKPRALPGEILIYTIVYSNNSTQPLDDIVVHDGTPAFTTFIDASCGAPLPATLTGCAVTLAPAVGATGAIEWTMTGLLAPAASGQVQYRVRVDN